MALTGPITGTQGKLIIATGVIGVGATDVIGRIFRWTMDMRRDIVPADHFDNSGNFKQKIGGMYDMIGTCEGWADAVQALNLTAFKTADKVPVAGTDTISLVLRDGTTDLAYTFDVLIAVISLNSRKSSEFNAFTLNYESSGAINTTDWTA